MARTADRAALDVTSSSREVAGLLEPLGSKIRLREARTRCEAAFAFAPAQRLVATTTAVVHGFQ
jgi:hypothetical protein